jgi:hypothetical protein
MSGAGSRLNALTRDLANRWRMTKASWGDRKAEEFEHKYLDELNASVDRAVQVIEQLERLAHKIKNDCE